jgi:hypothetical protein
MLGQEGIQNTGTAQRLRLQHRPPLGATRSLSRAVARGSGATDRLAAR